MKLRIINPKEERPSIFERFLSAGTLDGCFIIILAINLVVFIVKYILGVIVGQKKYDWIKFDETKIIIKGNTEKLEFDLDKIHDLQIHYNTKKFIDNSDYLKYSKVHFMNQNIQYEYYYLGSKKQVLRLCETLYEKQFKFKEFRNEHRVFKGRKPKYEEIQEIKLKYGIEW